MAVVIYNSQSLIPVTNVNWVKQYIKTGSQENIGTNFDITIDMLLYSWKGSPQSNGTFWTQSNYPPDENIAADSRLAALNAKMEAVRGLFANEGSLLEIQPWDGTSPLQCNPRNISVQFSSPNHYFEFVNCTITMQTDTIYGLILPSGEDNFSQYLQSANESWDLTLNQNQPESDIQQQTFTLTHSLQAQGKRHYNLDGSLTLDAWQSAQLWCQNRIGLNDPTRLISPTGLNVPSYFNLYNELRQENVNKKDGIYNFNQTWLLASGSATENFTITTTSGIQDGLIHCEIQGEITGYEQRDVNYAISGTRFANANAKWNTLYSGGVVYSRATNYTGITFNPMPLQTVVGKNPVAGTINYNYSFNNRPTNLIPNSRTESITIQDINPNDVFAKIPIPGRTNGPILQPINTISESIRTLQIECTMPAIQTNTFAAWSAGSPDYSSIINLVKPVANQVFQLDNNRDFSPKTGVGRMSITWVYQ